MRRNRALESAVSSVCQELGIKYRTLTHREEATLILEAVRDRVKDVRLSRQNR